MPDHEERKYIAVLREGWGSGKSEIQRTLGSPTRPAQYVDAAVVFEGTDEEAERVLCIYPVVAVGLLEENPIHK